MNANQEIIAELRRVLGERDAAREQLDLTKRELGRWVDREAQAVRECDELRAQRGLALARLENAIQLANQYAEERDDARSTIEDLNDEIARGREAIRIYRTETEAAKRERNQEREACAMYAERSARFAEQADKLQADLDDCRARSADIRTMLERVTRERDAAIARITEVGVMVATNGNALAKDAYRRGAEAMREACAVACRPMLRSMASRSELAGTLRALPIPEET